MRDTSDTWASLVSGSHEVISRVDAWYDGEKVAANLPVEEGQVEFDEQSFVRGRLTLRLAVTPDLIPKAATDPLAPYGQELHVRRGIRHPDGGLELISLGWFRIQSVGITEGWNYVEGGTSPWQTTGASLDVDAVDRAVKISDAQFLSPEKPVYTASCTNEIKRLVRTQVKIGTWNVIDAPVPPDLVYSDDRAAVVQALCSAMDGIGYMDADGLFVVRKIDTATNTGYTAEIGPRGTMINWSYVLTRDGVYNAVVARGQNSDRAPVQFLVTETQGPTRFDGPFGQAPLIFNSAFITSVADAYRIVNSTVASLRNSRDVEITLQIVPNPALEVGDMIWINTPRGAVDARISGLTIGLTAADGAMEITALVTRQGIWDLYGLDTTA